MEWWVSATGYLLELESALVSVKPVLEWALVLAQMDRA